MYLPLLEAITPINLSDEKEKFFKNNFNYNPIFKYKWEEIQIERNKYKNPYKQDFIYAVLDQNINLIVENAKNYFGVDTNKYLHKAEEIIKKSSLTYLNQNIEDLANEFEKAFKYFDLHEYKVEIANLHGFNCRPKTAKKLMQISKYANLDLASISGTIKHEMTHILRHENKLFNNLKKSYDYLSTEEGLASFLQDKSADSGLSLFQHAAEYVASEVGLHGSFIDIFNYFLSIGFTKDLAWKRAVRHKFGFKNTEIPGDILKPAMYFYYENETEKLTSDEILRLFVGKISIADLKDYPHYKGRFDQHKVLQFFGLSVH